MGSKGEGTAHGTDWHVPINARLIGGTLSNLSLNGKRYHHSGQWVSSNNRRLYYSRAVQMPISILISRQARLADCNCKSFEIVLLSLVLA